MHVMSQTRRVKAAGGTEMNVATNCVAQHNRAEAVAHAHKPRGREGHTTAVMS